MARFGILVGGGPAPGINGVIGAATILAERRGARVIGILEGFRWLMEGRTDRARELRADDVASIHLQGGSILQTSRANPTKKPGDLEKVVRALGELGVDHLITIGGDDTAFSARRVAEEAGGRLRVAHVPKTIDNDLPLPEGVPTFGFETAREQATRIVARLLEDARTTGRWYFVVMMGRSAGHLALGAGKAAGATLDLDPGGVRRRQDPPRRGGAARRRLDREAPRPGPPPRRRHPRGGRRRKARPRRPRGPRGRSPRRARPRPPRRGPPRSRAEGGGAEGAGGPRPEAHPRREGRRLRAALRRAHRFRSRLHPGPRGRRGAGAARRHPGRHDHAASRAPSWRFPSPRSWTRRPDAPACASSTRRRTPSRAPRRSRCASSARTSRTRSASRRSRRRRSCRRSR